MNALTLDTSPRWLPRLIATISRENDRSRAILEAGEIPLATFEPDERALTQAATLGRPRDRPHVFAMSRRALARDFVGAAGAVFVYTKHAASPISVRVPRCRPTTVPFVDRATISIFVSERLGRRVAPLRRAIARFYANAELSIELAPHATFDRTVVSIEIDVRRDPAVASLTGWDNQDVFAHVAGIAEVTLQAR